MAASVHSPNKSHGWHPVARKRFILLSAGLSGCMVYKAAGISEFTVRLNNALKLCRLLLYIFPLVDSIFLF